jgi:hypothetical protein
MSRRRVHKAKVWRDKDHPKPLWHWHCSCGLGLPCWRSWRDCLDTAFAHVARYR